MKWGMQYRTRDHQDSQWGEWKWLPDSLFFSNAYHPHYFEFRWWTTDEPVFWREA